LSFLQNFLKKRAGLNPEATMSLMDHVESLRWHIVRSLIAMIVCAIVVFVNIDFIFDYIILGPAKSDFIAYKWLCTLGELIHVDVLCMTGVDLEFQNTQLIGQFMLSFSASFMIGFIVSFPYIFWEFWKFIKPALTISELKMARGIDFWSSYLFFLGVAFAYYIIAPFTINFFANYELSPQFKNIITIKNYYDTVSDLVLGMGIVFELPVVVYFLSKIGILTPQLMRDKRRYAIVIIMFLAAIITPPDWFSIFLVAVPLTLLYEAGIIISSRIVKEKQEKKRKEDEDTLDW